MTSSQSIDETIAGFIFDMDGVLCDSEPFICEAAMEMFRQTYDVTVKKEDFIPFVGAGEDRFVGGVGEKYGIAMTMPRDKLRTYEIYLQIIRGRLHPLPGAVEFIQMCRAKGKKIALATAADAIKMRGNLEQIGIAPETFQAIITGDDVKRKKPDPQVFLLAAAGWDLLHQVAWWSKTLSTASAPPKPRGRDASASRAAFRRRCCVTMVRTGRLPILLPCQAMLLTRAH